MFGTIRRSPFLFLSFSIFLSSWASSVEEDWNKTVYFCTSQGCVPLETSKEDSTNLKNSLPVNQVKVSTDPFGPQGVIYFPKSLILSSTLSTQTPQDTSSSEKRKRRVKVTLSGSCKDYPFKKKARTTNPQKPPVTTTTSQMTTLQFTRQTAAKNRKAAIQEFLQKERDEQGKKATEAFLQREREEQEKFQKLPYPPAKLSDFLPLGPVPRPEENISNHAESSITKTTHPNTHKFLTDYLKEEKLALYLSRCLDPLLKEELLSFFSSFYSEKELKDWLS